MVEHHSSLDGILDKCVRGEKLTRPETKLLNKSIRSLPPVPMAEIWSDIERRIKADAGPPAAVIKPARRRGQYFTAAACYLAAAAIVILVFLGIFWYTLHKGSTRPEAKITPEVIVRVPEKPLVPPSKQAVLTLADNSTISLDSLPVGTVIGLADNLSVKKNSPDQLTYTMNAGSGSGLAGWNRLAVGAQHQAVAFRLPDGSRVHLTPGSTLRYPVARDGQALLEIEGEAWLAVTPNSQLRVAIRGSEGMEAEVLGTSLAIRSRPGETEQRVWLISGAVKVSVNEESRLLKNAGAIVARKGKLIEEGLNCGRELFAWAGIRTDMHFERMDFGSAIGEIAASFGLKVENPEGVKGIPVTGTFYRDQSPEKILKELECVESGTAFFLRKGNRIIITRTSEAK